MGFAVIGKGTWWSSRQRANLNEERAESVITKTLIRQLCHACRICRSGVELGECDAELVLDHRSERRVTAWHPIILLVDIAEDGSTSNTPPVAFVRRAVLPNDFEAIIAQYLNNMSSLKCRKLPASHPMLDAARHNEPLGNRIFAAASRMKAADSAANEELQREDNPFSRWHWSRQ